METNSSNSKQTAGFSVIELLVGVAIIGIMATIAMPSYRNYAARARQTEAKSQLSAIYAIQKSFRGENAYYTGCLSTIGFSPEGGRRYYTVGFHEGFYGFDLDPTKSFANCDTSATGKIDNVTWFRANSHVAPGNAPPDYLELPIDSGVDTGRFLVYAIGRIGLSNDLDYWSIDNRKNLVSSNSAGTTGGMGLVTISGDQ